MPKKILPRLKAPSDTVQLKKRITRDSTIAVTAAREADAQRKRLGRSSFKETSLRDTAADAKRRTLWQQMRLDEARRKKPASPSP